MVQELLVVTEALVRAVTHATLLWRTCRWTVYDIIYSSCHRRRSWSTIDSRVWCRVEKSASATDIFTRWRVCLGASFCCASANTNTRTFTSSLCSPFDKDAARLWPDSLLANSNLMPLCTSPTPQSAAWQTCHWQTHNAFYGALLSLYSLTWTHPVGALHGEQPLFDRL